MNHIAAAVVDTDVFSLMGLRRANNDSRVAGWREYLTGRRVLISFQTRAEVLAGATLAVRSAPRCAASATYTASAKVTFARSRYASANNPRI